MEIFHSLCLYFTRCMCHLGVLTKRAAWCLAFALVLLSHVQKGWAFSISQPPAETVLEAGQTVVVGMDLGNLPGVTKVAYYWYREDEDMLKALVEEKLALVSTAKHSPPFGGNLLVPEEAIGTYRLLAVAEQGGRQSKVALEAIFDEVLFQIEPTAELQEIEFQTNKPLRFGRAGGVKVYDQLDALGTTFELPVMGFFSDGITRVIRHHSTGTTYHSANESIVTVNADGVLRLTGNGATVLTVENRGQVATLEVVVEVNENPNQPPVADAGNTQSFFAGDRVVLNGLRSYDPEGGALQFRWLQVRGSKIPLLDPYSAQAKFLAPLVASERTFRFKLLVTDPQGADSFPAYVDILVRP